VGIGGLTDDRALLLRLLTCTMMNLWRSVLIGNAPPFTRRLSDFLSAEPQPGDFVMEMSTAYDPSRDQHRFGRFVRKECRPIAGNHDADATDVVHWIIAGDGAEYFWTNAGFLRVPTEILSSMVT
jgi:hypothetical protein